MPGAPDDGMQAAEQRAKRSLAFEAGGAPSPSPAGAAASPRRTAAAVEATRSSPRPRRTPLRAPAAAGGSRAANNSANASPAKARGAGSLRASPARARAVPSALTLPASSVPSSPQAKMAAAARAAAAAAGIPMESLLAGSPARAKPPQRRYSRGGRADDEGTPQKKTCNCKNSRCLKLYCECFASGRYCDGCNCTNCFNNSTHESVRREAVEQTLERNPMAFRPKIETDQADTPGGKHQKGCNCKKSFCLKKYCECFQAGIICQDNCRCIDCKNYEGSEQREAILGGQGYVASPSPAKRARTAAGGSRAGRHSGVGAPAAAPAAAAAAALQAQRMEHAGSAAGVAGMMPALPLGTTPAARAAMHDALAHMGYTPASALPAAMQMQAAARAPGHAGAGLAPQQHIHRSLLAGVVKPEVVESLAELLLLTSHREGQRVDEEEAAAAAAAEQKPLVGGGETGGAGGKGGGASASGGAQAAVNGSAASGSAEAAGAAAAAARRAVSPDTEALLCDESGVGEAAVEPPLAAAGGAEGVQVSKRYKAQEAVILREFATTLNKIVSVGARRADVWLQSQPNTTGDGKPPAEL